MSSSCDVNTFNSFAISHQCFIENLPISMWWTLNYLPFEMCNGSKFEWWSKTWGHKELDVCLQDSLNGVFNLGQVSGCEYWDHNSGQRYLRFCCSKWILTCVVLDCTMLFHTQYVTYFLNQTKKCWVLLVENHFPLQSLNPKAFHLNLNKKVLITFLKVLEANECAKWPCMEKAFNVKAWFLQL